jgi:hypothetical protein
MFVLADEVLERPNDVLRGVEFRRRCTSSGPARMFPSVFGRHLAAARARRVHLHEGPFATDSGDCDLLKKPLEELMVQNCVSEHSRGLGIFFLLVCEAH